MSRHPYLQLRGGVYRLRVRVPDELRPLVGKTEITKSLRSSDVKEARERARLERVKLDAEWAGLRRRLSSKRPSTLSEAEIWYLVSRWFVKAERWNANTPVSRDRTRHDAEVELGHVSTWEQAGASVFKEADRLLKEAGIELPPESQSFIQLQKALHKAWIETERRQLNRAFPAAGQHLDPDFAELTKNTTVQPVAKNTVASVMKAVDDDATRPRARGKSALKRDAHWRVIKEFFGDDTDIVSVTRAEIREFMDLLQRLPSNAVKHFPGKTIFEAAELGTARKLPVMSVDTANSYMRQLGSLFRFALNERIIEADPSAGLLFARPKVKAKDKRLPLRS